MCTHIEKVWFMFLRTIYVETGLQRPKSWRMIIRPIVLGLLTCIIDSIQATEGRSTVLEGSMRTARHKLLIPRVACFQIIKLQWLKNTKPRQTWQLS